MEVTKQSESKIGLALSGGGYRAAAYHLGTMRKLNALGILDKVDVISTVSGGSIVGVDYLLHLKSNEGYDTFERKHIEKLKISVIRKVLYSNNAKLIYAGLLLWLLAILYLHFTSFYWLSIPVLIVGVVVLIIYQFRIFPVSKIIENTYNEIFFKGKKLGDLPETPVIAINSTNLETGRQFTFSQDRMGDSSYDYPEQPNIQNFRPIRFLPIKFPVARAVMASSGVPFAFTPVGIAEVFFENIEDVGRVNPVLVDGGVYDNQGMHKLTQEKSKYQCQTIIVSDAGNKLPFKHSHGNLIMLLLRVCELFMNRIKKFQMMDNIYHNVVLHKKELAFISLGWDLEACIIGFVNNIKDGMVLPGVIEAHKIPPQYLSPFNFEAIKSYMEEITGYQNIPKLTKEEIDIARNVGTNLTALPDAEINALIKHAETMTELQVKLYCPSILN